MARGHGGQGAGGGRLADKANAVAPMRFPIIHGGGFRNIVVTAAIDTIGAALAVKGEYVFVIVGHLVVPFKRRGRDWPAP